MNQWIGSGENILMISDLERGWGVATVEWEVIVKDLEELLQHAEQRGILGVLHLVRMVFLRWRPFITDAGPPRGSIGFYSREAELPGNPASPDGNMNCSGIIPR